MSDDLDEESRKSGAAPAQSERTLSAPGVYAQRAEHALETRQAQGVVRPPVRLVGRAARGTACRLELTARRAGVLRSSASVWQDDR